jgi:hypothetical protein
MSVPNDTHFVLHLRDHGGMGPFPPSEPTPRCYCGLSAFMKQSRHPTSARRAFYCCQLKRRPLTLDTYLQGCSFYQWINGDEIFDPMIMLFPYDSWKSVPYSELVRWVQPPPNPPEMIEAEKLTVALRRLMNPPRCHCGPSARLTTSSKPRAFIPFYYCALPDVVSYHESKVSLSSSTFCTYNVILATLVFSERVPIL